MAGLQIIVTATDPEGNIDVEDFRAKAEANKDNLFGAMITYPSTHGIFEESIRELVKIIHDNGGQVFMDGANMNGQWFDKSRIYRRRRLPFKFAQDICYASRWWWPGCRSDLCG